MQRTKLVGLELLLNNVGSAKTGGWGWGDRGWGDRGGSSVRLDFLTC
ncbi:hypothetical protein [Thermoleptolyngbya sp.]